MSVNSEIEKIAKALSGEEALREKNENAQKAKDRLEEKKRLAFQKKVLSGELKLKKEEAGSTSSPIDENTDEREEKIVQNIKLYTWTAPIRVQFPYNKRTFVAIVAMSMFFMLYLALLGNYGLMLSIIALLFLIYVAGTTAPIDVQHTITARGIDTMDKLYEWFMLDGFWFAYKNGEYVMIVETKLRVPSKLIMIVGESEKEALFVLLRDKLLYTEIRRQSVFHKSIYGEYLTLESMLENVKKLKKEDSKKEKGAIKSRKVIVKKKSSARKSSKRKIAQ